MTTKKILTLSLTIVSAGLLFSACSLTPKTTPADSATTTEDSMMMQPEEEMAVEAKLETPPSDSTDLNDLDQELNDFTVINEDFSNL